MYVIVVSSKYGIYRIRGRDPTKNKEVSAKELGIVFCAAVNLGPFVGCICEGLGTVKFSSRGC